MVLDHLTLQLSLILWKDELENMLNPKFEDIYFKKIYIDFLALLCLFSYH